MTTQEKADIVSRLNEASIQKNQFEIISLLPQAATEIASLRRELEEARTALEPFAEAAHSYDPDEGDGDDIAWSHDFTIGSLRRARAAIRNLAGEKADG